MTLAVERDIKQQIKKNHERSRQGLRLKVETFVLGLTVFTKKLRPDLGLAKGSTLRLASRRLKYLKMVLNMEFSKKEFSFGRCKSGRSQMLCDSCIALTLQQTHKLHC